MATLLMSTMGKQRYIHRLLHLAFTSFPMLIAHLGLLFRQVPISSFGHRSLLIQTTSKCLFALGTTWYMVQVGRIRVCVCIQSVPQAQLSIRLWSFDAGRIVNKKSGHGKWIGMLRIMEKANKESLLQCWIFNRVPSRRTRLLFKTSEKTRINLKRY